MQPYFSFEEELWARRHNVQLTLNRFERFLEQPVVPRGPAGSPDEHRAVLSNVIRHNGRFMMWYTGMRPPPRDAGDAARVTSQCLAYSPDGITWEKPDLRLSGCPAAGWPDNVIPDLSEDAYNLGVMRFGDRFIATHSYPQANRDETTFTIVTSSDGLHWQRSARPSIDAVHFEGCCSLFRFRGRFWVLGQGLSPYYTMPDGRRCGRVMFAYGSRDLRTWRRGPDVAYAYPIPKYFPEAGVQNHSGASPVVRGRVVLGLMGQFWPAGFSEFVRSTFGLIYSYDGAHWSEPFTAEPLLLPHVESWDCGALHQGLGLYSRGNTSYTWYSGFDGGNLWSVRGAIGCVRMRRDGFAHFGPAGTAATVQTVPIRLTRNGRSIYVNAQATPRSPIEIAVLDDQGRRQLAAAVVERAGVLLPALTMAAEAPPEVVLRFRLSGRSKLYAFYTGPTVDPKAYLAEWREG